MHIYSGVRQVFMSLWGRVFELFISKSRITRVLNKRKQRLIYFLKAYIMGYIMAYQSFVQLIQFSKYTAICLLSFLLAVCFRDNLKDENLNITFMIVKLNIIRRNTNIFYTNLIKKKNFTDRYEITFKVRVWVQVLQPYPYLKFRCEYHWVVVAKSTIVNALNCIVKTISNHEKDIFFMNYKNTSALKSCVQKVYKKIRPAKQIDQFYRSNFLLLKIDCIVLKILIRFYKNLY